MPLDICVLLFVKSAITGVKAKEGSFPLPDFAKYDVQKPDLQTISLELFSLPWLLKSPGAIGEKSKARFLS